MHKKTTTETNQNDPITMFPKLEPRGGWVFSQLPNGDFEWILI